MKIEYADARDLLIPLVDTLAQIAASLDQIDQSLRRLVDYEDQRDARDEAVSRRRREDQR